MTITLDPNVLLAYYQVKTGQTSSLAASAAGTTTTASHPTPPWDSTTASNATATTTGTTTSASGATSASTLAAANSLASSLLAGSQLINPSATKLNVSVTNPEADSDYQNLFALYQGLGSLQTLATAAGQSGVSSSELAQLQQAFSAGLQQVQTFLTSSPFEEFQVADGTVTSSEQASAGVPQETDVYTTGLTASSASALVPGLQGDAQFAVTATSPSGTATTVNFNLADMGSTPRTLANVVSYLNTTLAAAGLKTRFADTYVAATSTSSATSATTTTTTTAPSGVTYGTPSSSSTTTGYVSLEIQGSALENLSFSAPAGTPSVFVGQTSTAPSIPDALVSLAASTTAATTTTTAASVAAALGATSASTSASTTTPTTASQLLALDPSGQSATTAGDRLWTDNLPASATVQATTTASDGSVYVLADLDGTTNGQTIQGSQDVALLKYDSAGDLVYTRTLGAADSATGYALAVSPDGSQVAVAGSVTGVLDPTATSSSSSDSSSTTLETPPSQSFVTVLDSASGDQLWTQTQAGSDDNQVNAVAFGSDSTVYVAGQTLAALPGTSGAGGTQSAYIQGFSAKATTDPTTQETTWTAQSSFTTEFGTSGINRATGLAVSGSSLYVSSVENGDAVVRQYNVASPGAPTLTASQDLGSLQGGNVAGLALAPDGSVIVAGTTHNAALNAGQVTSAFSGGQDAFVAQLSANLDPAAGESLAYLNNGQDTTATAVAVAGGQVYIAGQTATGASTTSGSVSETGYAAELDPSTGQLAWSQGFSGLEGNAAPNSIAVDTGGSSVLDALGLPDGAIPYTTSDTLVANSSVAAGDSFYLQVGSGAPQAVTVSADDTFPTLATKIEQGSGYRVTATTFTNSAGQQSLKITPVYSTGGVPVALEAGPAGADALGPLGLKAGLITNASTTSGTTAATSGAAPTNSLKAAYTVNAPTTLNLNSTGSVTAAQTQIATALAEVQSIYYDMVTPPSSNKGNTAATANDSALITFYNNQAAGYASALARLTGGASTTASLL